MRPGPAGGRRGGHQHGGPPFGPFGRPPHGRPPHGRGPPPGWILARGIHRRVVGFLLLALLLGGVSGAALHAGALHGHSGWGLLVLGGALLLAIGPLAWVAALRIAWPLRQLAGIATELHRGRLESREHLRAGEDEVGAVATALRGMGDRVARQLQDQRALMAAVSHELRSPLGRARVLVELAREGAGGDTVYDDLQGEIDAMDTLVGDLLAAARIDFEALSPRPLQAVEVARRAAELAGLPPDVVVDDRLPGADAPWVQADATLLARALAGVLDNARRYGASTVHLHVRARHATVRFEAVDDGPGFPADPETAFQPFWRGPTVEGRPAPGGSGLGLALVRQIAQAHHGEAGASNRPGGGAAVWIELPLAVDDP